MPHSHQTEVESIQQHPPDWLKRGVYVFYPKLNILFEPQRLRYLRDKDQLAVFYTSVRSVLVNRCRLAEPADLFKEIDLYIGGQRYAKQIEGQRVRLSIGAKEHIIQLESDANVLVFANAFDGKVIELSGDEHWLNEISIPPKSQ